MFRRLLIVLSLFVGTNVQAQQYEVSNLMGRWRSHHDGTTGDLLFISESTGAFLSPNGLLYNNINYTTSVKKDMIGIKYTVDIGRKKKPTYIDALIKFLNDSTFLLKFGTSLSNKFDTTSKRVRLYKKVKQEKPGSEPRLPTYNDLVGEWAVFFKGKIKNVQLVFEDKGTVIFKDSTQERAATYKVDFKKQPIPIDFCVESVMEINAYLMFEKEDVMRVEFFKNGRGDHFTMLGRNVMFKKQEPGNNTH